VVFGSNGPVGTHDRANTLGPALIVGRKGSFGKINYSTQPCFAIDTTYYIDGRSTNADLRWLYYALPLLKLDALSQDTGVPGLAREFAYEQWLPALSLAEQRDIATFLDRETAKTDALIAKKERQIALLREKKDALINDAVTRGLDPFVRLKDSRVRWIEAIPQHWDCAPLYSRYSIQLGKMLDQKAATGLAQAPYLRNTNIQWEHVDVEDLLHMDFDPSERRKFALMPGDLLVCEGGEVGRTAIWRGEVDLCYFQKAVHRVRPARQGEVSRFLFYVLYAAAKRDVFAIEGNKSTIVHLTAEKLRQHRFPFPPPVEQQEIVVFLDEQTGKIDALIAKVQAHIDKLREHRIALISAAVTGRIDVREGTV